MVRHEKVHQITLTAILVAIIFLLAFTPLGYLVVGPIAATTIQMPVIIGAILMGPAGGTVLGLFFGLSAVVKVLTMPGADPIATLALSVSPLSYLLVCIGSRVLMGFLTGLLAKGLKKVPCLGQKHTGIAYGITGFAGSLMNTVFYLGSLWMFCAESVAEAQGIDVSAVGSVVMTVVWAAGIPEALVSCVIVMAVCKAAEKVIRHN